MDHGATCTANLKFKLPKANKGKKLAFKLSFPGNSSVSAFTKSIKLKVK